MRRVVVTGLGLVTPLADGVEASWERILDGQSGAGTITKFDASHLATTYACEVRYGDGSDGTFNPDAYLDKKEQRKVDEFIQFGLAAAHQAVRDADWMPEDEESRLRTGVMIGSGIGGLNSIAETALLIRDKGPRRVSPFFIPGALINLISGNVSIKYGFKGPNHAVVTACSTGAHAIGDAARLIMFGDADVMVAGGAEAAISEIGIAGFNACKALSTKRGDDPKAASRPYDADRDGFVMGEARELWCSRNMSMPRRAGRRSMPRFAAMVCRGMPITSPRLLKMAKGGSGRCGRRSGMRASHRRISITSTRMAPRPWRM
jgi:3-oxoacyl-[acyl-carrier-protein] synthase II